MFANPNTLWIEILVVVLTLTFLLLLLGRYIYKKRHGLPTGECACCSNKGKNLVKMYHKSCSKCK